MKKSNKTQGLPLEKYFSCAQTIYQTQLAIMLTTVIICCLIVLCTILEFIYWILLTLNMTPPPALYTLNIVLELNFVKYYFKACCYILKGPSSLDYSRVQAVTSHFSQNNVLRNILTLDFPLSVRNSKFFIYTYYSVRFNAAV